MLYRSLVVYLSLLLLAAARTNANELVQHNEKTFGGQQVFVITGLQPMTVIFRKSRYEKGLLITGTLRYGQELRIEDCEFADSSLVLSLGGGDKVAFGEEPSRVNDAEQTDFSRRKLTFVRNTFTGGPSQLNLHTKLNTKNRNLDHTDILLDGNNFTGWESSTESGAMATIQACVTAEKATVTFRNNIIFTVVRPTEPREYYYGVRLLGTDYKNSSILFENETYACDARCLKVQDSDFVSSTFTIQNSSIRYKARDGTAPSGLNTLEFTTSVHFIDGSNFTVINNRLMMEISFKLTGFAFVTYARLASGSRFNFWRNYVYSKMKGAAHALRLDGYLETGSVATLLENTFEAISTENARAVAVFITGDWSGGSQVNVWNNTCKATANRITHGIRLYEGKHRDVAFQIVGNSVETVSNDGEEGRGILVESFKSVEGHLSMLIAENNVTVSGRGNARGIDMTVVVCGTSAHCFFDIKRNRVSTLAEQFEDSFALSIQQFELGVPGSSIFIAENYLNAQHQTDKKKIYGIHLLDNDRCNKCKIISRGNLLGGDGKLRVGYALDRESLHGISLIQDHVAATTSVFEIVRALPAADPANLPENFVVRCVSTYSFGRFDANKAIQLTRTSVLSGLSLKEEDSYAKQIVVEGEASTELGGENLETGFPYAVANPQAEFADLKVLNFPTSRTVWTVFLSSSLGTLQGFSQEVEKDFDIPYLSGGGGSSSIPTTASLKQLVIRDVLGFDLQEEVDPATRQGTGYFVVVYTMVEKVFVKRISRATGTGTEQQLNTDPKDGPAESNWDKSISLTRLTNGTFVAFWKRASGLASCTFDTVPALKRTPSGILFPADQILGGAMSVPLVVTLQPKTDLWMIFRSSQSRSGASLRWIQDTNSAEYADGPRFNEDGIRAGGITMGTGSGGGPVYGLQLQIVALEAENKIVAAWCKSDGIYLNVLSHELDRVVGEILVGEGNADADSTTKEAHSPGLGLVNNGQEIIVAFVSSAANGNAVLAQRFTVSAQPIGSVRTIYKEANVINKSPRVLVVNDTHSLIWWIAQGAKRGIMRTTWIVSSPGDVDSPCNRCEVANDCVEDSTASVANTTTSSATSVLQERPASASVFADPSEAAWLNKVRFCECSCKTATELLSQKATTQTLDTVAELDQRLFLPDSASGTCSPFSALGDFEDFATVAVLPTEAPTTDVPTTAEAFSSNGASYGSVSSENEQTTIRQVTTTTGLPSMIATTRTTAVEDGTSSSMSNELTTPRPPDNDRNTTDPPQTPTPPTPTPVDFISVNVHLVEPSFSERDTKITEFDLVRGSRDLSRRRISLKIVANHSSSSSRSSGELPLIWNCHIFTPPNAAALGTAFLRTIFDDAPIFQSTSSSFDENATAAENNGGGESSSSLSPEDAYYIRRRNRNDKSSSPDLTYSGPFTKEISTLVTEQSVSSCTEDTLSIFFQAAPDFEIDQDLQVRLRWPDSARRNTSLSQKVLAKGTFSLIPDQPSGTIFVLPEKSRTGLGDESMPSDGSVSAAPRGIPFPQNIANKYFQVGEILDGRGIDRVGTDDISATSQAHFTIEANNRKVALTVAEPVVQSATATAAASSVVAAAAGSPAIAVQGARTALLLSLINCEDNTEDDLGIFEHPLGVSIPFNPSTPEEKRLGPWVGAAIFNPALMVCVLLLHCLSALIYGKLVKKNISFSEAAAVMMLPSLDAILILPLLPSTVVAATTLFRQGGEEQIHLIAAGIASFTAFIYLVFVAKITTFGFHAQFENYPKEGKLKAHWLRVFLTGPGEYEDAGVTMVVKRKKVDGNFLLHEKLQREKAEGADAFDDLTKKRDSNDNDSSDDELSKPLIDSSKTASSSSVPPPPPPPPPLLAPATVSSESTTVDVTKDNCENNNSKGEVTSQSQGGEGAGNPVEEDEAKALADDEEEDEVEVYSTLWVDKYFLYFDIYRDGRQIFTVVETIATILFAIIEAWRPTTAEGCNNLIIIMAVLFFIMFLVVVIVRPYVSKYEGIAGFLIALIQFVGAACALAFSVGGSQTALNLGAWVASIGMYLLGVKALLDFIITIYDVIKDRCTDGGGLKTYNKAVAEVRRLDREAERKQKREEEALDQAEEAAAFAAQRAGTLNINGSGSQGLLSLPPPPPGMPPPPGGSMSMYTNPLLLRQQQQQQMTPYQLQHSHQVQAALMNGAPLPLRRTDPADRAKVLDFHQNSGVIAAGGKPNPLLCQNRSSMIGEDINNDFSKKPIHPSSWKIRTVPGSRK